jgi:sugar lactone lactonase YvrE
MRIALEDIRTVGAGLVRPECVLAHSSGLLIAPDWTDPGGVALIAPDGRVERVLATRPGPGVDLPVRPNGIALEDGGAILLAHMADETGGVYRLHPDGRCEVVTDRVDGEAMPPANFVAIRDGRVWITVSTRLIHRSRDYRPDASTGFIAVHDADGTRVAADGLGYTNECLFSPDGRTLWAVETFGRRILAFDVEGAGLSNRRTLAVFGAGDFPDGIARLADGSLVATSIVSNRLLRIMPDGSVETVLEDSDPDHLAEVERAFTGGTMGRPHLAVARSRMLRNISNIAFGGPDLKTAYLGCLLGDTIAVFDSPVAGSAPPHWTADLGALGRILEKAP